jgi:hypothetical protein
MAYFDYLPLDILAPGTYQLSREQSVRFDESDLSRMAVAFNNLKPRRPAPLVIGHPEDDSPRYGIVDRLSVENKSLVGIARELSASFLSTLKDGGYPRYAAQFYGPDNPDNPSPGNWILKHVGFRGPVPPVVRGFLTTDAEFMESLSGPGREIEIEMRFGGPGLLELSQFASSPRRAEDLARRARALQDAAAADGTRLSASEAVRAITGFFVNDNARKA